MGMRPNTHFDKTGWKFLITSFKEQTGHAFTKTQLKNKWDGCKKDWRIWNKLISETGVGWNSELGIISASDEWWKQKIQEIRGAKKFRHVGIEPSLKNKFDRMYSNIVATGTFAWALSSGVPADSDVDPGTSNADIAHDGLEEGSGDSEEDVIPNFQTDMVRMVGGINMSSSSNTKSSGKRKERDHYDVRGRKKKTSGIQLLSRCNQLLESISTKSDSTFVNLDRDGCSIREVMAELHSIPGVSIEDEFHDFATEYLSLRRKREMWASMGDKEQKLRWLQ
ncbi:L10-interacting MYB domain-containing protein [Populus trichocarpa]|uniref:L10-interacting MYB domain-containing protein n=1 Tax=Populus trichocarpa TaxID=3694 RepID=UPI00227892FE|nr:L10-interacting MYB domain-containing protein [Populus trichocarpa]